MSTSDGLNLPGHFFAESRSAWREWLCANQQTVRGVWLVTWRKSSGNPVLAYEDAVEEALCVGWVDSRPGKVDEARTKLYFAPRNPKSGWARTNKVRVERLIAAGLMREAGQRAVDDAKARGTWTLLDDVENLVVPDDLAAAFDPQARAFWDAFPNSARRGILEWIVQAKTPGTRAKRIAETARLAALNQRANQWTPKP